MGSLTLRLVDQTEAWVENVRGMLWASGADYPRRVFLAMGFETDTKPLLVIGAANRSVDGAEVAIVLKNLAIELFQLSLGEGKVERRDVVEPNIVLRLESDSELPCGPEALGRLMLSWGGRRRSSDLEVMTWVVDCDLRRFSDQLLFEAASGLFGVAKKLEADGSSE
jgi:hypothetical protein